MEKLLIGWLLIGIAVVYAKTIQNRAHYFDREFSTSTLLLMIIGIAIWPIVLFWLYKDFRKYASMRNKFKNEKDELDILLDEIEEGLNNSQNTDDEAP